VPDTIACPAGKGSSNTFYLSGDKWELSGWSLSSLQVIVIIEVIAPTLVPAKVGDQIKKNRRDALIRRSGSGLASPQIQKVLKGLQALRCITQISAVTLAAKLDNVSGKDRSCNRRLPILIRFRH
jgi:hypothetical protein